MTNPATLGLFQKRIEGDDCLLELARLRFQQAGMGAELYAANLSELEWLLQFRPAPDCVSFAHLARDIDWGAERGQDRIVEFAGRFAGRVRGLVVHDQPGMASNPKAFLDAARRLDSRLSRIDAAPLLFIEYAAGLDPEVFAAFCGSIRGLHKISVCVDVGHVGIWQVRSAYSRRRPGRDVCSLKSESHLSPDLLAEVEAAVDSALPRVLGLIGSVGPAGKPVHFHLHDGHPLSRTSPFGVPDHLSFLAEIPAITESSGRRILAPMFGAAGLAQIVSTALCALGREWVSFTLEIHPAHQRLGLGDAAGLFGHWRDKTGAEEMNQWLSVLADNHRLLLDSMKPGTDGTAVCTE
jgi:hypothetical protein